MAAYVGHVAAETINDKRHRLYMRLKFWVTGLIALIVAFVYQYRATRADERRQQAAASWQRSALPTIILDSVKSFDSVVQQNATHLIEVLSAAMDENQNLYLEYDDPNSPMFHKLDPLYLDTFVQLRPAADRVRNATRRYLRVN
jgi:hypothetical protein